jgi:hypothetical protein
VFGQSQTVSAFFEQFHRSRFTGEFKPLKNLWCCLFGIKIVKQKLSDAADYISFVNCEKLPYEKGAAL